MAKLAQALIVLILVAAVGFIAWTLAGPGKTAAPQTATAPSTPLPAPASTPTVATEPATEPSTQPPAPAPTVAEQKIPPAPSFTPQVGQSVRLRRDVMIPLSYGMGKLKAGDTVIVKSVHGSTVTFSAFGEDRTADLEMLAPEN